MDKASVERLRFDRRLQQRPDWIEKADQDAYLDALPDVSVKMTTVAEEEKAVEEAAANAAEAAQAATPPAPAFTATPVLVPESAAAPTAGDFSTTRSFGGFGRDSDEN